MTSVSEAGKFGPHRKTLLIGQQDISRIEDDGAARKGLDFERGLDEAEVVAHRLQVVLVNDTDN